MISFLKRNNKPDFWIKYLDKFKPKSPNKISKTRFVVFDTETTGLEPATDRILSIGAIAVKNNNILVADSFEIYIKQEKFNRDTVKIHGILKQGHLKKTTEIEALEMFLNFIGNSVLVAHHIGFDLKMINTALKRMNLGRLKNKTIDTGVLYKKLNDKENKHFSLDVLCDAFKIPKHDRHTAAGDAYLTAQLFLKILSKIKQERTLHYSDLFRNSENKGLL
ncbi:MAG: 3'-5' exonuclease [Flavobacteriaceae bacterium]|nr:3'-5' exonuclease [Flavobacteriaceae bacterium]